MGLATKVIIGTARSAAAESLNGKTALLSRASSVITTFMAMESTNGATGAFILAAG